MNVSNKTALRLKNRYGNWAMVTGATSGIGLELSKQLAHVGFNLLLTGRNESVLTQIADEFNREFNVEVIVLVADLALEEDVNRLLLTSKNYPIGLVILSAGFGTSGKFFQNTFEEENEMLQLNCVSLLAMTHHFSQLFVEQKRGGIVLLSSIVSFQGTPYAANYAATKAYVQTLAEGIALELKPYNVDVLAVAPGPVATNFGQKAKLLMKQSLLPNQVALPILKALGRRKVVYPGWLSKLIHLALMTAPRRLKIRIMGKIMHGMTLKK
jgi:short-subunit dehydrogenase